MFSRLWSKEKKEPAYRRDVLGEFLGKGRGIDD